MKKYLLLTTAFLSLASISHATDEQGESRPSSSASQIQRDPQAEITTIIKKYALNNLARNSFIGLKTENNAIVEGVSYRFWVPGESEEEDQAIREIFQENLPSAYAVVSNKKQVLNVVDAFEDIERKSVVITYQYGGALIGQLTGWLNSSNASQPGYTFCVEANLEQYDFNKLKKLISLIKEQPNEEMQKLKAVIARLEEEKAHLLQNVTNGSATAMPANSFAPPPPPLPTSEFAPPPPPPAPGSGKISAAKQKVVILSTADYQADYEALDASVKARVSTWKDARIEFYLKVLKEKGSEQADTFLNLTDEQAQKVLKMPSYASQLAYISLTPEARMQKDTEDAEKAQRAVEAASKQGDMLTELLSRRTPVAHYEPGINKDEKSKTIDSSSPSFAQALNLDVSAKEQQAFENARRLWSAVSLPRKKQVLDFFPNDIILKGILLRTIRGEIVTLDSHKQGQYTAPTILKSGFSLLKQQRETSEELRFKAEDIRDLSVYALLNAKAIGINANYILPIVETLRKQTF